MPAAEITYTRRRPLLAAAVLGLAGTLTALGYMLLPHPYTMLLFLLLGQVMILAAIAIFGVVVARDLRARLESVTTKRFGKGDIIFRQGEAGDHIYVIDTGTVEVIREEEGETESVLAVLGPGEYFGEMALLTQAPRNATVRAVSDVDTLTIHRDDFAKLHGSLPALRRSIEQVLKQRLAE